MDFGRMILAGHSQGGGHAAFIAMRHEVARVLMFGSPKDFSTRFNQPADGAAAGACSTNRRAGRRVRGP
jgi:pimeloyl-ACP methyl ester carboxylesterase